MYSTTIPRFAPPSRIASRKNGASSIVSRLGPLDLDTIRVAAPSVFAVAPHASRSALYSYIPTSHILEGLAKEGFHPYITIYDDGYGPLFTLSHVFGISAIIRARTWEDAWSICEDEFFPDATETEEEFIEEYGENFTEDGVWQENFGFRGNSGCNGNKSSIYSKDINGDYLNLLTEDAMEENGILLSIDGGNA